MKIFKTALITGAANGVGFALAAQLSEKGANVALVDLDAKVNDAALEIQMKTGGKAIAYQMDVSRLDQWKKVIEKINTDFGRLDILINNAAVSVESALNDCPDSDIDWVLDINLKGAVYGVKACLPLLLQSPEANIVNVSSAAGLSGFPNKTLYCAAKSGLKGFSEALSAELYHTRICVGCAHPGPIRTSMLDRSHIYDPAKAQQMRKYLNEKGMPPEKVAAAILKGMLSKKTEMLISAESHSLWWMKRLIPNVFVRLTGKYQHRLPA